MSATTDQSAPKKRQLLAQLPGSLRSFIATEAGGAGLLLAATVIALVWANSPLSDSYESLWHTDLTIRLGDWTLDKDLRHWLDEGLMALFFFVIGLEVRREWAIGELRDRARVTIPVIAGIGGMIVPALIFVLIAPSGEAAGGWGIVIATDTAFLLGAMAIVGPACPTQLRVFLLTLSIVDDIVAISVIGIFYSESIDAIALLVAALCLVGIALASRLGAWRGSTYILLGLGLWLATVISGLHPTIAGMAAGLLVTAYNPEREECWRRPRRRTPSASRRSPASRARPPAASSAPSPPTSGCRSCCTRGRRCVIVPLFALANAGVDMRDGVLADALGSPLTWAVVAGLVVGKTVGITVGALGAIRARLGLLPQGVGEGQVVGGAALSGIGFTVSLLIAGLAFDSPTLQEEAKIGVLLAAALAVGAGWLAFSWRRCCAVRSAPGCRRSWTRRSTPSAITSAARSTRR